MVKIGIIQMLTGMNKQKNIEKAQCFVKECVKNGAEIVVLPEIFNGPYSTKCFREYAEFEGGYTWNCLSEMASKNSVYLIGGSIPEIDSENKVYNTSFVFDPLGKRVARHRKMHLFDIDIEGGQKFRESDVFTPGDDVTTFDTPFGKIGICICFDLRFVELFRLMVNDGAKIIIVPAAFNMTTGPAHWELLFRQRAVDNQCFTIGVAPAQNADALYVSYGHSIVCSSWGDVLLQLGFEECAKVVEIDINHVDTIRKQLPILSARRNDLYSLNLFSKI